MASSSTTVELPSDQRDFLKRLAAENRTTSVSWAMRRCIDLAKEITDDGRTNGQGDRSSTTASSSA
jgi:hypothetical protein